MNAVFDLAIFGASIKEQRQKRGLAIETAAEKGDVSHMTWRRIETGRSVQRRSYLAVDIAFGLELGTTQDVLSGKQSWPNPRRRAQVLTRAAAVAPRVLGKYIGTAVGAVLTDHELDDAPDPNVHELAHCVLRLASAGGVS